MIPNVHCIDYKLYQIAMIWIVFCAISWNRNTFRVECIKLNGKAKSKDTSLETHDLKLRACLHSPEGNSLTKPFHVLTSNLPLSKKKNLRTSHITLKSFVFCMTVFSPVSDIYISILVFNSQRNSTFYLKKKANRRGNTPELWEYENDFQIGATIASAHC